MKAAQVGDTRTNIRTNPTVVRENEVDFLTNLQHPALSPPVVVEAELPGVHIRDVDTFAHLRRSKQVIEITARLLDI